MAFKVYHVSIMHRLTLPLNIVCAVLLIILAARILADIATDRIDAFSSGQLKSTHAAQSSPKNHATLQSYAIILEKGLLGPATRGTLTPIMQQSTSTVPATTQNDLVLLGTAAGSPRSSFALIRRTSSNEERVFRVGEKVFDLGVLTAVRKETAELRSGDRLITLRTPDAPPGTAKPDSQGQPMQSTTAGVIQPALGGVGIIDQRALNAALDNIGQAMTDARLLPSVKEGKVEGFRVSEVKPQGVFAAVGLKNGDVLLKINDFPVDSPEKAIQSFMTLKGQNRIKLDLVRDGSPTSLAYDIR